MQSEQLKGKDIVLLLGKTGAGKTTTINFLVGQPMGTQKIGNIINIIATTELKGFKIGHEAQSETKLINSIELPDTNLHVCDTPGLEDTEGPTIDIGNTLGIPKAISKCRSVRPVILLNWKTIDESKGDTFRQNLQGLVNLIPNIHEYMNYTQDPSVKGKAQIMICFTALPNEHDE